MNAGHVAQMLVFVLMVFMALVLISGSIAGGLGIFVILYLMLVYFLVVETKEQIRELEDALHDSR